MGHERFESKIKELRELITNSDDSDCSGIREFLDGDRELRAHLSSRNDWSRAGWLADPLTVAARRGKPQILAVLLRDYGLKVDASSVDGRTHDCNALDLAIAFNHPECVRVLLDHGADIERAGILVGVPFDNSFQLEQLMSERKIPLGPGARLREDKGIREMLEQEPGRRRAQKQLKERLAHLPEMTSQLEKAQELEAKVQEVSKQGEKEKGIIQKKYEKKLRDHENAVNNNLRKLKNNRDYLPPSRVELLKEEIDSLAELSKDVTESQGEAAEIGQEDYGCKICFELPAGNAFVCCRCELILCNRCKDRVVHRPGGNATCPGCRANFADGVNPRRSRIVENEVQKIRRSAK